MNRRIVWGIVVAFGATAAGGWNAYSQVFDKKVEFLPGDANQPTVWKENVFIPGADNQPKVLKDNVFVVPPASRHPATLGLWTHRLSGDSSLEGEVHSKLKAYADADDDKTRTTARTEMAELLGKQFDALQGQREKEIQELETRVKKLRETLSKRAAAKQQIVNSRLNQLLSEVEGLGWGTPGEAGDSPYFRGGGLVPMTAPPSDVGP